MKLVTGLLLIFCTPSLSFALGDTVEEEKQVILERCQDLVGDSGAAMVKSCVDRDINALLELGDLAESNGPVLRRCYKLMGDFGWYLVKACVDQDLEAQKELDNL